MGVGSIMTLALILKHFNTWKVPMLQERLKIIIEKYSALTIHEDSRAKQYLWRPVPNASTREAPTADSLQRLYFPTMILEGNQAFYYLRVYHPILTQTVIQITIWGLHILQVLAVASCFLELQGYSSAVRLLVCFDVSVQKTFQRSAKPIIKTRG